MNPSTAAYAVAAEAVSYAYPDGLKALTNVTFNAGEGEFVAIIGCNGSGKTTLMKMLLRLLNPLEGRVLLGRQDIRQMKAAELYRRIGMVFQNPADQLFAPTVGQDVAFGPRNMGLAESEVAVRVEESLVAVNALGLRDRPIHHLSFGEQKRVCLAGVLAMRPSVLVLDEPTAGLDPAGEAQMIELLLKLNRQQKITMILSTHAVDLLPILAGRIYVLKGGQVLREGTPGEIFHDRQMIARAGLRLPLIAQLFEGLTEQLPLTIEQARRLIGQSAFATEGAMR